MHRDELWGTVFLLATLAAALLSQYPWIHLPLEIDEHVSHWIAIDPGHLPDSTCWQRSLEISATPPLSFAAQRVCISLFGDAEWVLRLPSLTGYLGSIIFLYLAGRVCLSSGELRSGCSSRYAALASSLLAFHPEIVDRVRLGRPYGLSLMCAAGLLWVTLQGTVGHRQQRRDSNPPEPGFNARHLNWSILWSSLWTLLATCCLWTHYVNIPFVICTGLFWLWLTWYLPAEYRPPLSLCLISAGICLLFALPLVPSLYRLVTLSEFLDYQTAAPTLLSAWGSFWVAGLPVMIAGVSIVSYLGKKSSSPRENNRATWLTLTGLFCVGLAPVFMLSLAAWTGTESLGEPRYRLVYAPAGCLWAIAFIARRVNFSRGVVIAAAMLGASWFASTTGPAVPWTSRELGSHAAREWQEAGALIEQNATGDDLLLVYGGLVESRLVPVFYEDELFLDYVGCRLGGPYLKRPLARWGLPGPWISFPEFEAALLERLSSQPADSNIWLVVATDTDIGVQTLQHASDLCTARGFVEQSRRETERVTLVQLRPLADPPNAP